MAVIAFRSRTTGTAAASTSVQASKPAGLADGDVLVAVHARSGSLLASSPSGWSTAESAAITNDVGVTVQYKVVSSAASEPSVYAWMSTSPTSHAVTVAAYSSVRSTSPVEVDGSSVRTDAVVLAPAVTTASRDAALLRVFVARGSGGGSMYVPAGVTLRAGVGVSGVGFLLGDEPFTGPGVSAARQTYATLLGTIGVTLALRAANVAPNAPGSLSPAGGLTLDNTAGQRFSWVPSDPNTGDTQSAYSLRYRLTSTTTWTTVTAPTTASFRDFAAGALAVGNYEWQVATTDSQGLTGPYSGSAFFTVAAPPSGPSILSPTSGGTVSATPSTVSWSTSTQTAYQVRTVADNAGAANTSTVYTDTGTVNDATARSASVAFGTNNRAEHVQVRVFDGALWSGWSSVRVTVSYTRPAVPSVGVAAAGSGLLVTPVFPTPSGGEPSVVSWDVLRSELTRDGLTWTAGVRVAAGRAPGSSFSDRRVAHRQEYAYAVRAVGSNGATATSPYVSHLGTAPPPEDPGDGGGEPPPAGTNTYDSAVYDSAVYG